MESNIPLPTDNIYKFYALFGLLLLVFSLAETFYIGHSTNDIIFQYVVESETIKQIEKPSAADTAKLKVLQSKYEIALADRTFEQHAFGALGGVAVLLIAYGFWKWHKEVQPVQDKMAKLQLEKLQYEVDQMKGSASPPSLKEETQKETLEAED